MEKRARFAKNIYIRTSKQPEINARLKIKEDMLGPSKIHELLVVKSCLAQTD